MFKLVSAGNGGFEKAGSVFPAFASASLGDIRSDRICRPAHLCRHPELLAFREQRGQLVDVDDQSAGALPRLQPLEVPHEVVLQGQRPFRYGPIQKPENDII